MSIAMVSDEVFSKILKPDTRTICIARTGAGKTFGAMLCAAHALSRGIRPVVLDAGGSWSSFAAAFNGKTFDIRNDRFKVPVGGRGLTEPVVFDFDFSTTERELVLTKIPTPKFIAFCEALSRDTFPSFLILDETYYLTGYSAHVQKIAEALHNHKSPVLVLSQSQEENYLTWLAPIFGQFKTLDFLPLSGS